MEEGKPSFTANGVAMLRAAHLLLDEEPMIFEDTLALELSGFESEVNLRSKLDALFTELIPSLGPELTQILFRNMRANNVVRSRYTEDELAKAIERGVRQYVILGAGLDSFAYRRRDLAEVVQVFEVDHPATQNWKRERMQALGIHLPPNLTFIPIDFEKQLLAEALAAEGFNKGEPAFFSWLGVTPYLTEEAIFTTLKVVAASAPGSEIVFGYFVPDTLLDPEAQRMAIAARTRFGAGRGEPLLSFFEPESLAARLKGMGFTQVWNFGPEEASDRYLAGRTDGLSVSPWSYHMKARVGDAT